MGGRVVVEAWGAVANGMELYFGEMHSLHRVQVVEDRVLSQFVGLRLRRTGLTSSWTFEMILSPLDGCMIRVLPFV